MIFSYNPKEDNFYCLYCNKITLPTRGDITTLINPNPIKPLVPGNHTIRYSCCHCLHNKKIDIDYKIQANSCNNIPAYIPPVKGEFYMFLNQISIYWDYKQFLHVLLNADRSWILLRLVQGR